MCCLMVSVACLRERVCVCAHARVRAEVVGEIAGDTHTYTHTLSLSNTHTHIHSLSLSLSLSHTHAHTHAHAHTCTHKLSLALSPSHTHTPRFLCRPMASREVCVRKRDSSCVTHTHPPFQVPLNGECCVCERERRCVCRVCVHTSTRYVSDRYVHVSIDR